VRVRWSNKAGPAGAPPSHLDTAAPSPLHVFDQGFRLQSFEFPNVQRSSFEFTGVVATIAPSRLHVPIDHTARCIWAELQL